MAKQLHYPSSPQSPRFMLKLAMTNGIKTTSKLLLTSVLGTWVVSLLSFLLLSHIENYWISLIISVVALFLLIYFCMTGVTQCNAAYLDKKMSDVTALKYTLSKSMGLITYIVIMIVSLLALTWVSSHLLQHVFATGTVALGVARIILGCLYVFFLAATFLVLPLMMITDKTLGHLFSEVMHLAITHWIRCFLCLFVWLIALDLLVGDLALLLVPALIKISYSLLIVKTITAVVVVPLLVSYTTLMAHDFILRLQNDKH